MGASYWMIEGVGINTNKAEPSLDVRNFLFGKPFNNLGDLLTHCDDTDSITYGDDGDGGSYFFYSPSMSWHHIANEPDSLEEVHRRIIKAVQVVINLSDHEVEAMIDDDLYVAGIGS